MRKVIAAIAAILLLAGGSMMAVYLVSGDPRGPAAPPPAAPLEARPANPAATELPPQAAADLSRLGTGLPGAPSAPALQAPPPPKPDAGSWESVPPVARLGKLGQLGAALNLRLNELEPRISGCFAAAAARGGRMANTDNYTETRDYAPIEDSGTTILMLQVESLRDAVRVVDAPVETQGGTSPGAIACVQGLLRGQVVPVPGMAAGERFRILHTLLQ